MGDALDGDTALADQEVVTFVSVDMPFTNYSAHRIRIWGQTFSTVEHAFQYKKFEAIDPAWAARIKRARSPHEAKKLGWQHTIDSKQWDDVRVQIMRELLRTKAYQHKDVSDALIATGTKAIIEKGAGNTFWGIGKNLTGKNTLGKLWIQIRGELTAAKPLTAGRR